MKIYDSKKQRSVMYQIIGVNRIFNTPKPVSFTAGAKSACPAGGKQSKMPFERALKN